MRFRNMALAAFVMGGMTAIAIAQSPDPAVFGHFYRLPPKVMNGRTVWPRENDVVDLARLPDGNAFVKVDMRLDGRTCSFAGIARFEAREHVYRDLQADPSGACQIVFTHEVGRLVWRDNGHCTARCPGGGLSGSLPARHRIVGQRAASLPGYQAALAEWQAGLLTHGM